MVPDVVYICNIMVTIFQYPGCDVYKLTQNVTNVKWVKTGSRCGSRIFLKNISFSIDNGGVSVRVRAR